MDEYLHFENAFFVQAIVIFWIFCSESVLITVFFTLFFNTILYG